MGFEFGNRQARPAEAAAAPSPDAGRPVPERNLGAAMAADLIAGLE
jgi:hypothetical protein